MKNANSLFTILFILGSTWLIYVYIGYPILLWLSAIGTHFHPETSDNFLPSVSVLIAARNEEKDIGWKIAETLSWNYPNERLEVLVASDASEDRTDDILCGIDDSRLKYIRLDRRLGKSEALNRLAKIASGDILFFTDANSHVHSKCVRRMVRHFADADVGCVTGSDRTAEEETESAVAAGEKSYWAYESRLQKLESKLGSVLICFGAIFCIRRSLFEPLQPDLANDLELPIRIGSAGYSLVFEPDAWATERATKSPREEFNRRRRICGQGLLGFWRLRNCLQGLRAWQFISRKFLRWTMLFPLLLMLVSSVALSFNSMFSIILVAQVAFYGAAAGGWVLASRGCKQLRIFYLPFYFVLVNIAALTGLVDACLGRRYSIWEVASLTRGAETT